MRPRTRARFLSAVLLAASVVGVAPVGAEQQPVPMPGDTRLVQFSFDPNDSYTVLSRPGAVTDIQYSPDERIVALALGDTTQWMTSKTPGHVFIKPLRSDIYTSATLVTDKRTYQLTLRASPESGKWYQQVRWVYPDEMMWKAQEQERRRDREETERKRLDDIGVSPGVAIEKLNFSYSVQGEAPFKPVTVFDDGKFTWIRLGQGVQELPALFVLTEQGAELANYVVKGDYLVIQRLVPAALLKLGNAQVRINRGDAKLTWFGRD